MSPSAPPPVRIIAQYSVKCAKGSSFPPSYCLGPLDTLLPPFIPIAVVYVYEKDIDTEIIPVDRLRRALERLLDRYPQLTGRLHQNESDGSREVVRLGTGAELVVAECEYRLDECTALSERFTVQDLPGGGNALLAPFDFISQPLVELPVFAIQHTRFACGAVSLGIRILHALTDAEGLLQLVRNLAQLYHKLDSNDAEGTRLDFIPRYHSYMSDLMGGQMPENVRNEALRYQPTLYYAPSSQLTAPSSSLLEVTTTSSPVTGRFLHFTAEELSAMKAHAKDPTGGDSWVSTYDAFAAHLYRVVYRARVRLRRKNPQLPPLSSPDFLTPVNIRRRLGPEYLPAHYVGNALLTTFPCLTHEELHDGPLWKVAKAIHELTRNDSTTSKDAMNRTIEWMAAQEDIREIKQGFRYGNASFIMSQWNKMDMYEGATFDTAPLLVQIPFTSIMYDGLAYTLPTKAANGDIDVALSLDDLLWDSMYEDGELHMFSRTRD